MATRIEDILTRARDTLSDPKKERWSDDMLLRLLDEACKILVEHTGYIKSRILVPLIADQAIYTLPDTVRKITRILDKNGVSLPFYTHEGADKRFGIYWETLVQDPVVAIIYDRLKTNEFKVYPMPVTVDPALVVPTTPEYGFTTSIVDVAVTGVNDPYGVITGLIAPSVDSLTVYCTMNPVTITTVNDTLEFNPIFDTALKFYITGMALRNDKDTQNRQVGNEELSFFRTELKAITKDSASNFTMSPTFRTVPYGGAFDG